MVATEARTIRDNWSLDDFKVLADAKQRLDIEMAAARGKQKIVSLDERLTRVAKWVKDDGVTRMPLQCRDKWENHFPKYRKIQNWEKAIPSRLSSFWQMDPQERQSHGLPRSFDKTMFEVLDSQFGADVLVDPECEGSRGTEVCGERVGGEHTENTEDWVESAQEVNSSLIHLY
ncbi:hypothetical protein L7F22_038585 [Adiantum nelumboides]|nr:hypothetical protein [Adiantum nelumboides]